MSPARPHDVTAFGPAETTGESAGALEVRAGRAVLRVEALGDHVLRIRAGADGLPPEDGSWAVRPEARGSRAAARVEGGVLSTGALRAEVAPDPFALTITDADRRVILADEPGRGLRFDGEGFALSKVMPAGESYFGLGDKTGPLNRRGQAFSLWNTDAYAFGRARTRSTRRSPSSWGWTRRGAPGACCWTRPGGASSISAGAHPGGWSSGPRAARSTTM
jgi:alpha-glucosidase